MHTARRFCLVWLMALLAGCQPRPAVLAVSTAAATQPPPAATAARVVTTVVPLPTQAPTLTPIPVTPTPATFDQCAASDGQITDSFPRLCQVAGGPVLEEPLPTGIRFSRHLGGFGRIWPASVAPTSDGGALIAGGTQGWLGYVLKVDAEGKQEWLDKVGPEIEAAHMGEHSFDCREARESQGGGFSALCYEFRPPSMEIYWIRYDRTGQRTGAEPIMQKPGMILTLDTQGSPAWLHTFGMIGGQVIETADGGYALALETSFNGPDDRTYLIKADGNKQYAWDRLLCALTGLEPQHDQVSCHRNSMRDIIQTQDGGFALLGSESRQQGSYLLKIDSMGKTEWLYYYSYGNYDSFSALRQLANGGYLILGRREATTLLLRTDKDGRVVSEKNLGPAWPGNFTRLITLAGGDFLMVGMSESNGGTEEELWLVGVDGK